MIFPSQIMLTGKVALVTAGANGIGKGIALGLARFDADVVILDKDAEAGAGIVAEVEAAGRRARFILANVTDQGEVRRAFASVDEEFGRLDILVNNAGGVRQQRFEDMSDSSLRRHVDLNLTSMFTATGAALPLMRKGGSGGSIVNVASVEGLRAGPLLAVYAACKAAMINFTRSMALELAEAGIRVNAIAPDQCETPGSLAPPGRPSGYLPHGHPARLRYVPLRRSGTVNDCAAAAVFLSSDLAAYITGVTLAVDGGTTAAAGWNRNSADEWTLYVDD
jgi:NAD(P)-dependent dehydrogenase (short-subunit alcohol dehydrogenase family)